MGAMPWCSCPAIVVGVAAGAVADPAPVAGAVAVAAAAAAAVPAGSAGGAGAGAGVDTGTGASGVCRGVHPTSKGKIRVAAARPRAMGVFTLSRIHNRRWWDQTCSLPIRRQARQRRDQRALGPTL